MSPFAVEVKNLSKHYGKLKAVDNVSFQVRRGSSFGLLGLNGAGKTTTFKMLVSLIRPDRGTAFIDGFDVVKEPMKVRARIGYVAENPSFYPRMSTQELLMYLCRLLDVPPGERQPRIDRNLDLVGLVDKKNEYIGTYSRGMRHRLALAQALLSEPQVLFLDEPTLGLDPLGAKSMRELIIRLQSEHEVSIMMSSHVLPEVEAICSEVGIFDHGRLLAQDSIANLRSTASDTMNIEVILDEPDEAVDNALRRLPGVQEVESQGASLTVRVQKDEEMRPRVLDCVREIHSGILYFGIKESSLEDILLRLLENNRS